MARHLGPRCKRMRRRQMNLELVSARISLDKKCKINQTPGQHQARSKPSDYALHLNEKQKLREMYGVLERQFRKYYKTAQSKSKNKTLNVTVGDYLLIILESRLDNVVYRMGFASTRAEARQLVSHKAIMINGEQVNIPSCFVKVGDVVEVAPKARKQVRIAEALLLMEKVDRLPWLSVNAKEFKGELNTMPDPSQIAQDINVASIIEFYSK
jgi:small subunit ribosomal protein S4